MYAFRAAYDKNVMPLSHVLVSQHLRQRFRSARQAACASFSAANAPNPAEPLPVIAA
jgi:hypothetical protein